MKTPIYSIAGFTLLVGLIIFSSCGKGEESEKKEQKITGELISNSTCKSGMKSAEIVTGTPDSLSCVEYSFDSENNQLTLKHINAGFNCCPESLYVKTSVEGDTIVIKEIETSSLCDCDCLYDLEIVLEGVLSQKYQIEFAEPYANSQTGISFEVDLNSQAEGDFCVTRKQYPWGIESTN